MKKLFLLFVAMCCTVVQADIVKNVKYIDANGVERICAQATEVSYYETPNKWEKGWYVVGRDTEIANGVVCAGEVHLILTDGVTLTVQGAGDQAGIRVLEEDSLIIYGQTNQTGQLIVTGGSEGAGIGGNMGYSGHNITINSGIVTAIGGDSGAGIGGGIYAGGFNITINGGTVTAIGGYEKDFLNMGDAIGSGFWGANTSDIFVGDGVKVVADKTIIEHASISEDITKKIAGKNIVTTLDFRTALKAIDDAAGGSTDATITEIADVAKASIVWDVSIATADKVKSVSNLAVEKINAIKSILPLIGDDTNARNTTYISEIISYIVSATEVTDVNTKKTQAMTAIPAFMQGRSSAFGSLGTKQNGPAVKVTDKDDNEIILYSPKKVEYIKVKEN